MVFVFLYFSVTRVPFIKESVNQPTHPLGVLGWSGHVTNIMDTTTKQPTNHQPTP